MAKLRMALGGEMRGRIAGLSYVPSRQGTTVRGTPARAKRLTPAEAAQAARVARIGAFWADVGPEEAALWRAYAEGLVAAMPVLERRPMSPYNAFLMLTTRLLMLEPGRATVPMAPPAFAFLGDAVGIVAQASAPANAPSSDEGNRETAFAGTPPSQPPLQNEPLGEEASGVLFTANRANAEGVVTELLAQPLASGARAPQAGRYASRAFVAFEGPGDAAFVPLPPGWVALAARFVEEATGQASALLPLGVVRAG